jgi:hypothetical protein
MRGNLKLRNVGGDSTVYKFYRYVPKDFIFILCQCSVKVSYDTNFYQ